MGRVVLFLLLILSSPVFAQKIPLGEAIRKQQIEAPVSPPSMPSPSVQEAASKEIFEGHWHGLELIPITPELAQEYRITEGTKGLLIDEITLEAAGCGFLAGDMVQSIEGYPTTTLKEFLKATIKYQNRRQVKIQVFRRGKYLAIPLIAADYYNNLGYANMDGAPPIQPGAISPHKSRNKPCTACHLIMRGGGQLPTDEGDILPNPPPIALSAAPPHGYRGPCNNCHQIITKKKPILPQTPVPSTIPSVQTTETPQVQQQFVESITPPVPYSAQTTPGAPAAATSVPTSAASINEPVAWMGLDVVSSDETQGAIVNNVDPDSPAKGVGIKIGDVITKVGDVKVIDADHLKGIVSPLLPGDEVELSILRNNKEYTISFFLGERAFHGDMVSLKMIVIVGVFFLVYFLIFQDIFGHLLSFLLGTGVVLYLGDYYHFYTFQDAIKAVNFYILIFIIGMNILSAVLREAGFFDYVAKKITLVTKGDRWKILLLFCFLTYIISCFMDNIATILMMVPMTLALAKDLDFDPKPILICQVISSNIGGASTMVGDFPNMLIALSTEIQFHDFIFYEMPCCIMCLVAVIIYCKISQKKFFEKKYKGSKGTVFFLEIKKGLKTAITNKLAVRKGLIVLGFVLTGMILSGEIGINPAIIAFTGGMILLAICGMDRWRILKVVGIKDVVFFACLFVMVGAAEASGILQLFARLILDISGGSILLITLLMMWLAAGFCAFMNAGPTAALFIPVVMHIGIKPPHNIFWWGLSLGVLAGSSCFLTSASGGPLASTLVGKFWKKHKKELNKESALYNLKKALSFREYAKMGVPIMLIILIISSIYLTALYLI